MSSLKRPREVDLDIPRIKYHVTQTGRAFERLLKENSFAELNDAIRAKLELEPSAPLQMYRVQNDVKYDLEDEDDFAAMKSAAYAPDVFDVHILLKKTTKPVSRRAATPSKSRRVSIVLPNEKATDAPSTAQTSSEPTPANEETPAVEANPAPPKKRRKSVSAGDSAPAGPSILKRKATSDTNDDTPKENGTEEPPKKKQKSDKAAKKNEESSTSAKKQPPATKRKSLTDKSQKATSPTESSESSEPLIETSNSKSVESQGRSSPAPSSLKPTRSKQDASTSKPQSKPAKPAKKDEESSTSAKKQPPVAKRKTPTDKSQKADSSMESSESSESSVETSKSKPVDSEERSSSAPLTSKKSQPKQDGNSTSTSKPQSKPARPASRAAKPSAYAAEIAAMPPLLNYAELKNRVTEPKGNKGDSSGAIETAKDKKSGKKAKNQQESEDRTENTDNPKSADPPAQVDGKKKAEKKANEDVSKTNKKSADNAKDKADKPISVDTAKDKDKKGGSSKDPTGLAANKGPAKHPTAPSVFPNGQAKSMDTLVDEIETSIHSKKSNAPSKADKNIPPQKTTAPQADSQRKSSIPVLPFHSKLKLSQVAVQSNDEGSESESSSSSSGSSSNSNSDGEDVVPNRKSSLAKTTPSLESESSRQSVNLDAVDLNALLLGPSVKSIVKSLSKLEEEDDVVDEEEKPEESGELEEEEEIETQHSIIPETVRRLSATKSQAVDDQDDDESNSSTSISPPFVNSSAVKAVREESEIVRRMETSDEGSNKDSVPKSTSPDEGSPPTETTSISNEPDAALTQSPSKDTADKMEIEPMESSDHSTSATKPHTPSTPTPPIDDSRPHTPTPTKTQEPSTPVVKSTPRTPGTVRRMKDKNGRLPDQDDADVDATPVPATNSPKQSTVRPARTIVTRSRSTVDIEEPATSRRTTRQTSALPAPEKRVLRSSKVPALPSTPSKPTKVKEKPTKKTKERQTEEGDTTTVVPKNQKKPPGASQESVLGSQWQALPPIPSTPPSSQLDELQSTATNLKEGGARGLEPALEVSTSRKVIDDQDVENVVGGALQELDAEFVRPRSPLFLPGASQLSPSQYRVESMGLEFGPPPNSLQESSNSKPNVEAAPSETETEPESDKELAVPKLSQPLKSMFPSLSELSFNKFRPSFLMGSRSQGQDQGQNQTHNARTSSSKTATTTNNKSDSDDDDDDDDEDEDSSESEKGSHIPKNKRAGVGVVKKRKSRGLLR